MAGTLAFINVKPISQSLFKSNSKINPILSYYAPTIVPLSSPKSYWASIKSDIDAHLKQSIPMNEPFVVFDPMHQATFSAPPTTAPALCIAACELVGGHRDQAIAAASALHLAHVSFFIHEQIPSLTRDGQPESRTGVNQAIKPNIRLLTGDSLIPFGFEILSRAGDDSTQNFERITRVIVEITRAIGSQGMVLGQFNKLLYDEYKMREKFCFMSWVEDVLKKKEGELHACASTCGAILGGGSEDEIERLRRFGLYVGMFQGVSNWNGGNEEKWSVEKAVELRNLALEELEVFGEGKVEAIRELLETN